MIDPPLCDWRAILPWRSKRDRFAESLAELAIKRAIVNDFFEEQARQSVQRNEAFLRLMAQADELIASHKRGCP